jgi:hypothetical protein
VENEVEAKALKGLGIIAKVCPSFMGNIDDFDIHFKEGNKLYTSVSGNNFEVYGWNKIEKIAKLNPDFEFHLYGNTVEWKSDLPNVIVHGRVPREQMNKEIMEMQGGMRLAEFDGFSEILAKSILMGQYPVSFIEYPYIFKMNEVKRIKGKKTPNIEGRNWYRKNVNRFPWNNKI